MDMSLFPFAAGNGNDRVLSTPEQYRNLDLLTPPSSSESYSPAFLCSSKTNTPRSHRTKSNTGTLPFEFNQKVKIFSDGAAHRLSAILEEESEPEESNKRPCDQFSTPKKKQRVSRPYILTPTVPVEQKENSPIKVDFDLYNVQSVLVLKVPKNASNADSCNIPRKKDILTELANINSWHIIGDILNYLDEKDIVSVSEVSREWESIVSDVKSKRFLTEAKKGILASKENLGARPTPTCVKKCRNETTPRKMVSLVNLISPKRRAPLPLRSPQQSPNSKRFCYYVKEGKNLMPSEQLTSCPRCKYPARVQTMKAVCCKCHHAFCPQCRWAPHPDQKCSFVIGSPASPSPQKKSSRATLGSKASKRALRRL